MAEELEVDFKVAYVRVKNTGEGVEAAARQARYDAIFKAAHAFNADMVMTAHHQDDRLETFLIQWMRGSGVDGLATFPVARDVQGIKLVRPLMGLPRELLERYLELTELTWVDDESNADTAYLRNAIRHEVLPVMQAIRPGFKEAAARSVELVAKTVRRLKVSAPKLLCRIESGDTALMTMLLEKGILDFGLVVEEPDPRKFHAIELPAKDRWVLILPKDHPLAQKPALTFRDLQGLPLFCSAQGWHGDIDRWSGGRTDELSLESHVTLPTNGAVFVREGLGFLLTFEGLVDTGETSSLTCRPLDPPLTAHSYLVWRRNASVTPIAERFLAVLRELVEKEKGESGKEEKTQNVPERE